MNPIPSLSIIYISRRSMSHLLSKIGPCSSRSAMEPATSSSLPLADLTLGVYFAELFSPFPYLFYYCLAHSMALLSRATEFPLCASCDFWVISTLPFSATYIVILASFALTDSFSCASNTLVHRTPFATRVCTVLKAFTTILFSSDSFSAYYNSIA